MPERPDTAACRFAKHHSWELLFLLLLLVVVVLVLQQSVRRLHKAAVEETHEEQ